MQAKLLVKQAVESSTLSVLNKNDDADFIVYNENQDIPVIATNVKAINKIALNISLESNNALQLAKNEEITINLGTMSGIVFLNNIGPSIKVSFLPVSTVCYNYKVETSNIGINQVHYKITLLIVSDINLILPGKSLNEQITTETVIADCIVVGKVPQYVLGTKIYDLIP